jgi:hypothetical protein
MYCRDILQCIKTLFGDEDFIHELKLEPERHYIDEDQTTQIYYDMHTGKWWWTTQVRVAFRSSFLSCSHLAHRNGSMKN